MRALEKNPELRYQQVSEVKTCVETIAATPAGSSRREEAQTEKSELGTGIGNCPAFFAHGHFGRDADSGIFCFDRLLEFWSFRRFAGAGGRDDGHVRFCFHPGDNVLGWVAVAQIRRSGGRLYGMWLALFDGLVLPGLVLNVLLIFALLLANKFVNVWLLARWYPDLAEHAFLNNPHFLVWLLFATAMVIGSNHLVIADPVRREQAGELFSGRRRSRLESPARGCRRHGGRVGGCRAGGPSFSPGKAVNLGQKIFPKAIIKSFSGTLRQPDGGQRFLQPGQPGSGAARGFISPPPILPARQPTQNIGSATRLGPAGGE